MCIFFFVVVAVVLVAKKSILKITEKATTWRRHPMYTPSEKFRAAVGKLRRLSINAKIKQWCAFQVRIIL